MNVPRIHGLVLAGGRSSRMRRDKAAIEFRSGETQLDAAMKLLEGRVAKAFVSVRADQRDDPARARYAAHRGPRRHRRPHRRHQRRVRRSTRTWPGWCWPATCRSSMRQRWTPCCSRATRTSMPPHSSPATTACRNRCAPSTSRRARPALARANRRRPQLPAEIPHQRAYPAARAAQPARARQREHRGRV